MKCGPKKYAKGGAVRKPLKFADGGLVPMGSQPPGLAPMGSQVSGLAVPFPQPASGATPATAPASQMTQSQLANMMSQAQSQLSSQPLTRPGFNPDTAPKLPELIRNPKFGYGRSDDRGPGRFQPGPNVGPERPMPPKFGGDRGPGRSQPGPMPPRSGDMSGRGGPRRPDPNKGPTGGDRDLYKNPQFPVGPDFFGKLPGFKKGGMVNAKKKSSAAKGGSASSVRPRGASGRGVKACKVC